MERLSVIEKLSDSGIKTGLAIIPILPYIVEDDLENIIRAAYMYKARYILHKHLELKGDQKNVFMSNYAHGCSVMTGYDRIPSAT